MAKYPVSTSISSPSTEYTMNMDHYLGMDLSRDANQIDMYKSPDIYNMVPDNYADLDKRYGYKELFDELVDGETCTGMFYNSIVNSDRIYFTLTNHKMYIYTISTGVASDPSYFSLFYGDRIFGFNYGDRIYILTTGAYFYVDSAGANTIAGSTPLIVTESPMTGGGNPNEAKNLLTNRVVQSFSADGSTGTATLLYGDISTDSITILHNGVSVGVEDTAYTVNRTTGVIDFTAGTSPYGIPTAGTNNLTVEYGWQTNALQLITAREIYYCTIGDSFGGASELRIWLSGNPDYPSRDWRSGISDPTYFPDTGFDDIGSPNSAVTGYSALYGYQIILKEDEILRREYTFDSDNNSIFLIERLTRDVGCYYKDTVQVLNGFPCFLDRDGMYQLTSVDTNNERNVTPISVAVNRDNTHVGVDGLLATVEGKLLSSVDYQNQYLLFTEDGEYWRYDYNYLDDDGLGQWCRGKLKYGVIDILRIEDNLYIGNSTRASIGMQKEFDDIDLYSDSYYVSGTLTDFAITCYWVSKRFEFNTFTNLKLLSSIFFTIKRAALTSANLYFSSDVNSTWSLVNAISRAKASYFTYSWLVYSLFTYGGNTFPKNIRTKTKAKKIGFGQIKIENDVLYESLGLLNTSFKYLPQREVK